MIFSKKNPDHPFSEVMVTIQFQVHMGTQQDSDQDWRDDFEGSKVTPDAGCREKQRGIGLI